ncbi:Uncharacterised protein [Mycobacterium tuberculosis]|nr:Uncharacterised protein [Mycobacterium tuberculosis]
MVVPGGPTQPHVKRPSKRRLDDTGVGAGMAGGVAPPGPYRTAGRPTDHRRADHHQHRRRPCANIVGPVIQSCCSPTESEITRRAVADHRVQGVDGTISQHRRHAARSRPQQRHHLGVGGVFGHRLQRGTRQARAAQLGRVTPAQRRQQPSRRLDIVALQQVRYLAAGARQRSSAQRCPGGRRGGRHGPGPAG